MGAADSRPVDRPFRFGGDEPQNGQVVGAYLDRTQGASQGALIVTQNALENFNPQTGDRRFKLEPGPIFTCSDFQQNSRAGSVIAVGGQAGEVFVLDAATFMYVKSLNINDTGASAQPEQWSTGEGGVEMQSAKGGGQPGGRSLICRVTAVCLVEDDGLLVGDSAGVTRFFRLSGGDAEVVLPPPKQEPPAPPVAVAEDKGGPPRRGSRRPSLAPTGVASLCACRLPARSPGARALEHKAVADPQGQTPDRGAMAARPLPLGDLCFAVGHEERDIVIHCPAGAGQASERLRGPAEKPVALAHSASLGALLCLYSGSNSLWIWDLQKASCPPHTVSFGEELERLGQHTRSQVTCMSFQDGANVLVTGSSDGSFHVRRLQRDPQSGAFAVALTRHGRPSQHSTAPLTTVWYEFRRDRLVTGDVSGVMRVVEGAVGLKDISRSRQASMAGADSSALAREGSERRATPSPMAAM